MITPTGKGPFPLVIYAHPYGDTVRAVQHEEIAYHDIAICSFEFCGGSLNSRSDGASTDMSVMTEAADLQTVLETVKELPYIDNDRIYLMGMSQGGYVATIVASLYPGEISGMVLLCPAYVLQDFEKTFLKEKMIPERFWFRNMNIGKKYIYDLRNIDIYDMMRKYPGPVLIYYGDKDDIVPASYIERAVNTFPNAELITIPGAGHELPRKNEEMLLEGIISFVKREQISEPLPEPPVNPDDGVNDVPHSVHTAFIYVAPDTDPQKHNVMLPGSFLTLHVVGCSNYDQAAQIAKELVDKGCTAIELCAGFGNEGIAKIQKSVGPHIPVGAVKFDLHPLFGFTSGDQQF